MNISRILSFTYLSNINNEKQTKKVDTISSATKTQRIQKPDVISSATKTNGGDHFFEARA